ncbi:MAG: N-6 DNA methylase, partial [Vicinamibacterales bacterium]
MNTSAPGNRERRLRRSSFKGRVYDPCCGSGGMFVQSETFVLT